MFVRILVLNQISSSLVVSRECLMKRVQLEFQSQASCRSPGGPSVPRLQRPVDERHGVCGHDLPSGVHVPRHSPAAHVHGLCRTGMAVIHAVHFHSIIVNMITVRMAHLDTLCRATFSLQPSVFQNVSSRTIFCHHID